MRLALSFLLGIVAAQCPIPKSGKVVNCAAAGISSLTDIPDDVEELDLTDNAFTSVPSLARFKHLRRVSFDKNPIQAVQEFSFNGDDGQLSNLAVVSFEDCSNLDYVATAAFAYLASLSSVSFKNSGMFYLSPQAIYECPAVTSLDISNTNVKFVESQLVIYADSLETLRVGDVECNCINQWMAHENSPVDTRFDCAVEESHACPPMSVRDDYVFNFEEDTSNTAICFIVGSEIMTIDVQDGRQRRGKHIHFERSTKHDEDEYVCNAKDIKGESVTTKFTINITPNTRSYGADEDDVTDEAVEHAVSDYDFDRSSEIVAEAPEEELKNVDVEQPIGDIAAEDISSSFDSSLDESLEIDDNAVSNEMPDELDAVEIESTEETGDEHSEANESNADDGAESTTVPEFNAAGIWGGNDGSGDGGSGDFDDESASCGKLYVNQIVLVFVLSLLVFV